MFSGWKNEMQDKLKELDKRIVFIFICVKDEAGCQSLGNVHLIF